MLRFLYLNIYSFVLIGAGILTLLLPVYVFGFCVWLFVIQGIVALCLFSAGTKLFSVWGDKKRKVDVLVQRNRNKFRQETFAVFMEAPCGRLVVRSALRDLQKPEEYAALVRQRKLSQQPLLTRWRNHYMPVKTVVYFNESFDKEGGGS